MLSYAALRIGLRMFFSIWKLKLKRSQSMSMIVAIVLVLLLSLSRSKDLFPLVILRSSRDDPSRRYCVE